MSGKIMRDVLEQLKETGIPEDNRERVARMTALAIELREQLRACAVSFAKEHPRSDMGVLLQACIQLGGQAAYAMGMCPDAYAELCRFAAQAQAKECRDIDAARARRGQA